MTRMLTCCGAAAAFAGCPRGCFEGRRPIGGGCAAGPAPHAALGFCAEPAQKGHAVSVPAQESAPETECREGA